MRNVLSAIAALAALALAVVVFRPRLDVDVFSLLPGDSELVQGLALHQESFGSSRELMISVRSSQTDLSHRMAGDLAEVLQSSGLSRLVIWQNPLRGDPAPLGELLALYWMNQTKEAFRSLARRFDTQEVRPFLDGTLDRLATSLSPEVIGRLSRDPFGLTDPGDDLGAPLGDGGRDPFVSADGTFRILLVEAPVDPSQFFALRRWVQEVGDTVDRWRREAGVPAEVEIRITGNPAWAVEFGSGLLRDMQLAALGTILLVGALFWLVHRRWAPLFWLVSLLVLVLVSTMILGGLILGPLNVVSLGFAAILLGLAADYGLILYQELVVEPETAVAQHRKTVAPSILWAALTTSGAFLMVSRSSLPGLTQLGTLVALGILLSAGVMLVAFLPPLAGRIPAAGREDPRSGGDVSTLAPWLLTIVLVAVSMGVLVWRLPDVDYGTEELGGRSLESTAALREVLEELGDRGGTLWLLAEGSDESDVAQRMGAARPVLDRAVEKGLLAAYSLPDALLPRAERMAGNRETARWLAHRWEEVQEAALEVGFTQEGLALTEKVFASWQDLASTEGEIGPRDPVAAWLVRQVMARSSQGVLALGFLSAADNATVEDLLGLAREIPADSGCRIVGWPLLSESLFGVVGQDAKRVLLPLAGALLLFLTLAYRRIGEVLLSLLTLGLSFSSVLAVMSLSGWTWNLMNIMALPLLLGAGVDYSLHIQLALKRMHGDVARVRRSVGRAILLCAASTASAFGTLAFASNEGLASLGRICATGIIISGLISVFLLPLWWRACFRPAPPDRKTILQEPS